MVSRLHITAILLALLALAWLAHAAPFGRGVNGGHSAIVKQRSAGVAPSTGWTNDLLSQSRMTVFFSTTNALGEYNGCGGTNVLYMKVGGTWSNAGVCAIAGVNYGKTNKALYFDGVDDYGWPPTSENQIRGTNQFTVSAWINPVSNASATAYSIYQTGITSSGNCWWFYASPADRLLIVMLRTGGKSDKVISTPCLNYGAWNHVACVMTNGAQQLWCNGQLVANTASNWGVCDPPWAGAPRIGGMTVSGGTPIYYFAGFMDCYRIYNFCESSNSIWGEFWYGGGKDGNDQANYNDETVSYSY